MQSQEITIKQNERIIIRENIKVTPEYVGEITINVGEPMKNQNETIPYFTYSIEGSDMNGSFSVRRRYKDFDLLRRKLSVRWLGIYIPPISGKRSQSNFMQVFKKIEKKNQTAEIRYAETRKRFLRYFCGGIASRPYLFYCDLFQAFLRGGADYQASVTNLGKQYSFILGEYENNFKPLMELTSSLQLAAMIQVNEGHLKNLKQCQEKLFDIYSAILKNITARNQYNEQFNICMNTVIPEYQQKFLFNYVGKDRKRLILSQNEEFTIKLSQFKILTAANPTELYLQLVVYEIRQTRAFIEAIQGRKQAQNRRDDLKQRIQQKNKEMMNLLNGGFSFRAIFKTGSKQLQAKEIEMKIEILKNELYCIQKMIVIMVVNTNYEIEQYKCRKGREYGEMLKNVAEKQLAELSLYNQLLSIPKQTS